MLRTNAAELALRFSALQRAEIAEMVANGDNPKYRIGFSALQRAEIAEISDDGA